MLVTTHPPHWLRKVYKDRDYLIVFLTTYCTIEEIHTRMQYEFNEESILLFILAEHSGKVFVSFFIVEINT